MLNIEDKYNNDAWDKKVCDLGGNLHHSSSFLDYKASVLDQKPLCFEYILKDKLKGISTAVLIKKSRLFWPFKASSKTLYLPTVPLADSKVLYPFINKLIEYAKDFSLSELVIDSYQAENDGNELVGLGFDCKERLEFRIDLTEPEEKLFANIAYSHRRKIKKAIKSDISVSKAEKCSDSIEQLYALLKESNQRSATKNNSYNLSSIENFHKLKRYLLERSFGQIYFAKKDNEIVSGMFIGLFNNKAFYLYGGSNSLGFKLNAPALVVQELMISLKNQGIKEFNLGGVPAASTKEGHKEYGLFRFKKGFGGKVVSLHGGILHFR